MKKDLKYWKNNCEEDYIKTPISVLRYISELEKAKDLFINGLLIGVAIATVVWTIGYGILINKIDKVHKQQINHIIEKHNGQK